MLALQTSLICSITLSFDQVRIKHNQPQNLSPNSHPAIDTIHQTQDAVKVLWVCQHYSRHVAWPTIILRFMKIRWDPCVVNTKS